MIKLVIEKMPILKSSAQNRFLIRAEHIKITDQYRDGFTDFKFFVIEFYFDSSTRSTPIKYLEFIPCVNITKLTKAVDLKEEINMVYNNFTINTFFKILKELVFRDKTLSSKIYFLSKKDFLKFCLDLLDYVNEETCPKNYSKMKRFILHHNFLYLLS